MKTRIFAILTLLFLLIASCGRNKNMFILHGTVQDGTDSILVVGLDNRYEEVDTIFCDNGQFTWKFRPDTVTTLILALPDGRNHPVFAEKNIESFITIPSDTGLLSVSGGYCNDSYQTFYLASQNDSTMEQTIARIDSFITKDPFSEVTPYIIYEYMVCRYHAKEKDIESLIKRMSGNMQDAPYLVSLKSNFDKDVSLNQYLDNYAIYDSTGFRQSFLDLDGTTNHLLVCVWASWMGEKGIEARDTLSYFLNKYKDRLFNVTDISIDVNKDRWKETIKYDTVTWFSFNDPNGWEGKIAKTANLQTLPAFVLFTGTKRIISKHTSIEDLDKELDKTLSKIRVKEEDKPKKVTTTKDKPVQRQLKPER